MVDFYQCQNQKYLQIWLMLKFPDISETCITYRLFKKQGNGKTFSGCKNTKNFHQSSKHSS